MPPAIRRPELLARLILWTLLALVTPIQSARAQAVGSIPPQDAASMARIQQLVELPENKINIGVAALTFAKDVYPGLDINAYSRQIDELAQRAKRFIGNKKDPRQRVLALSEFFFNAEGYSYDFSRGASTKDVTYYLNGILDTKKGNCSTMPMLYLAIAQRLGYPIYPVAAPDHLFLRYVEGQNKYFNIEATSAEAGSPDDAVFIKGLDISERALSKGSYLRTMTYRQFLGDLLASNAVSFGQRGDSDRAINYLETAIHLNPQFPDYYDLLRIGYLQKSKRVNDANLVAEYRGRAQMNLLMTEELGFIRPN